MVDWRNGLAFRAYLATGHWGQFLGFWACCCQAVFSYCGAELIGIAAEETERQRYNLPKVVRRVSYRLIFYYVAAVFVLGLNVQANDPVLFDELSSGSGYFSPFILMVERAGISGLRHVINAVALIASVSVANANLYLSVLPLCNSINGRTEPFMLLQRRNKLPNSLKLRIDSMSLIMLSGYLLSQPGWHIFRSMKMGGQEMYSNNLYQNLIQGI